jgi:group I intron endonuclease
MSTCPVPTTRGIYTITNLLDGKYYVGSSLDLTKRLISHRTKLKNNNHINKYLQNAWNKYGEANFKFEVVLPLPDCCEEIIRAIEHEILEREFDNTYNIIKTVNLSEDEIQRRRRRKDNNRRKVAEDVLIYKTPQGKYRPSICINNKKINLGTYSTYKEALKARQEGEKKYLAKDYVHYDKPFCVPMNYRKIEKRVEVYLHHKGIRHVKTLKTEEEAYEYVKKLREELGITFP